MSTPGGFDPRNDPTAPSYEPPSYEAPTYEAPTYEAPTYEAPTYGPPSYGAPSYGPPPEAATPDHATPDHATPGPAVPEPATPGPGAPEGSGWYLAPPPASALPPEADGSHGFVYPAPGSYPTYRSGSGYPGPAPGQPGPRPRSSAGLWAALAGVVVIIALVAAGAFYALRSDDGDQVAGPPPTTSSAPSTSAPRTSGSPTGSPTGSGGGSASSTPTGAAEVMVPAVTPGFQGVLSQKENVAYDVPTGFEVQTPGTLVGYEDGNGKPLAVIHGVSTFRPDACADVRGSNRGNVGFKTAGTIDPAQAAQDGVKVFAEAAALNDDGTSAPVTTGPVTDVAVAQGTITAKMATATVTPPASAKCGAPTVAFTAVAFATPGGDTALFIMYLDQGTADALPADQAQQIVASLRPYTG